MPAYLPMQKSRKMTSSKFIDAYRAGDAAERAQRQAQVLGRQRDLRRDERAPERCVGVHQRLAMAGPGERRRGALLHQRRGRPFDPRQQLGQSGARQRRQRHDFAVLNGREIDLVHDDDVACSIPVFAAFDELPPLGPPVACRVEHQQPQVGAGGARPRPAHAFLLDGVGGFAKPRGVGQHHRPAAEIEMHFDDVARRAGGFRHDGGIATRQKIEQRGLAGIGRADDGDVQALAQALAAAVVEMGRDLGFQAA